MANGLMKSIPVCTHKVRVTTYFKSAPPSHDHAWLIIGKREIRRSNFSWWRPSSDVFNDHISTKEVGIGIGTPQREARTGITHATKAATRSVSTMIPSGQNSIYLADKNISMVEDKNLASFEAETTKRQGTTRRRGHRWGLGTVEERLKFRLKFKTIYITCTYLI